VKLVSGDLNKGYSGLTTYFSCQKMTYICY